MIEIRRSALVKYSPAQMFDLVNDVEAYPKRFAWCAGAQVLERGEDMVVARLDLKFAGFRQSFTTRNRLDPPRRLEMNLVGLQPPALQGHARLEALVDVVLEARALVQGDRAAALGVLVLALGHVR